MRTGMFLLLAASACARSFSLSATDLERLRAAPPIPLVHGVTPDPGIGCNSDLPDAVWGTTVGAAVRPGGGAALVARLASERRRDPLPRMAGPASVVWQAIELQRTASLRSSPPVDPARATAERLLALARRAPERLPLQPEPIRAASLAPADLAGRLGPGAVLVVEATRWVVNGCWYTYQPWFGARATLLDLGSGKVLSRATCGGLYPPDDAREAPPAELLADGSALYARLIEERAGTCAAELLSGLTAAPAR